MARNFLCGQFTPRARECSFCDSNKKRRYGDDNSAVRISRRLHRVHCMYSDFFVLRQRESLGYHVFHFLIQPECLEAIRFSSQLTSDVVRPLFPPALSSSASLSTPAIFFFFFFPFSQQPTPFVQSVKGPFSFLRRALETRMHRDLILSSR